MNYAFHIVYIARTVLLGICITFFSFLVDLMSNSNFEKEGYKIFHPVTSYL